MSLTTLSKWFVTVAGPILGFAIWVNTTHPHMPTSPDEWWAFFWQSAAFIGGGGILAKGVNHGIDAAKGPKS